MYLVALIISFITGYCHGDYNNDDTVGYAGMASAVNYMAAEAAKSILVSGGKAAGLFLFNL